MPQVIQTAQHRAQPWAQLLFPIFSTTTTKVPYTFRTSPSQSEGLSSPSPHTSHEAWTQSREDALSEEGRRLTAAQQRKHSRGGPPANQAGSKREKHMRGPNPFSFPPGTCFCPHRRRTLLTAGRNENREIYTTTVDQALTQILVGGKMEKEHPDSRREPQKQGARKSPNIPPGGLSHINQRVSLWKTPTPHPTPKYCWLYQRKYVTRATQGIQRGKMCGYEHDDLLGLLVTKHCCQYFSAHCLPLHGWWSLTDLQN